MNNAIGKKLAALMLAALMLVTGMPDGMSGYANVASAAETDENTQSGETVCMHAADVAVYEAVKGETVVTVPLLADGMVDLRCVDLTVQYKTADLTASIENCVLTIGDTVIGAEQADRGVLRFTGILKNPQEAKAVSGQIGYLTFVVNNKLTNSPVTSKISLQLAQLGPQTDPQTVQTTDAVVTLSKEPQADALYYGDVNKDGEITASDALSILKYIVGLPVNAQTEFDTTDALALRLADVNRDGSIAALDALTVLRIVVALEEAAACTEQPVYEQTTGEVLALPTLCESGEYGDLDGDSAVTMRDVLLAQMLADGQIESVPEGLQTYADVNGDGSVTAADAQMIEDFYLGSVAYFPAKPFVASGNIWIVGDSMASTHDTPDYKTPIMGWGVYLPSYLTDQAVVHNEARSGRSAKSYLHESNYTTVMEQMAWGDYLFFAMGNNDSHSDPNLYSDPYAGSDVEGSYMWYMKNHYIEPALHAGLKVVLIASDKPAFAEATHRMSEEYAKEGIFIPCIDITELENAALLAAAAEQYGSDVTPTEEQLNAVYLKLHGVDEKGDFNMHFSEYGANLVAKALADKIKALEIDLSQFVK